MTVNNQGSSRDQGDPGFLSTTTTDNADGGAIVTTRPSSRTAGVVKVNLLPPELAEERVLRKIQLGAAGGLAIAAALVGLLYYQQSQNLDDAKTALTKAQADNAHLKTEETLLGNVDVLFKQVDAADAMLASASAYEIHMSSYLDELSLRQPPNIWYNAVTITETPGGIPLPGAAAAGTAAGAAVPGATSAAASLGTVSIAGVGFAHDDVANWLESFAQMTGVTGVTLGSSTETLVGTNVPTVTWSTTAQLTLGALAPKDTDGSGNQ